MSVRHGLLLVSQHQPVGPSPAPLTLQPAPDVIEQHIPPEPSGQRLMVQRDAPPAGGTEGAEGERSVISEGAEDDWARLTVSHFGRKKSEGLSPLVASVAVLVGPRESCTAHGLAGSVIAHRPHVELVG